MPNNPPEQLTIALAKGRMQDDALALFAQAGIRVDESELQSRRLVIHSTDGRFSFVLVKPVRRGEQLCVYYGTAQRICVA